MTEGAGPVSQAIQGRRSVRSFGDQAGQPRIVEALLKDACAAPAASGGGPPFFSPPAVAEALALPDGGEPEFLFLLAPPAPGFNPSERPPIDVLDFLIER